MEPFLGEILLFAGNFAPRGFAFCHGQLLPINQNQALFSLLGTTYGGDGRTTMGLPDLRGRVPIHRGQGPGLSFRSQGSALGSETVALTVDQMEPHSHVLSATTAVASTSAGPTDVLATANRPVYGQADGPVMAGEAVGDAGGGAAHENMAPTAALHYIIAIFGIYPSRS